MAGKTVVVTGACGRMAGLLLADFRERYDLRLLDVRKEDPDGNPVGGVIRADLLDPDPETYRRHFAGAEAVVHCGFVGAASREQRFEAELDNVRMARNVYQISVEEGVRRVVVASSNHAADYYEPLILDGKLDVVTPDMQSRSDNYYGWAKDSYEHLGFVYAVGKVTGRALEVVQIRIGAPRETDVKNRKPGDMRGVRRSLGAYMSQRDMVQLFVKSLETEDIRDRFGIPFQIFYGISANFHAFWSIANAREVIGYEPEDNSELRFSDQIEEHIRAYKATQKEKE